MNGTRPSVAKRGKNGKTKPLQNRQKTFKHRYSCQEPSSWTASCQDIRFPPRVACNTIVQRTIFWGASEGRCSGSHGLRLPDSPVQKILRFRCSSSGSSSSNRGCSRRGSPGFVSRAGRRRAKKGAQKCFPNCHRSPNNQDPKMHPKFDPIFSGRGLPPNT